MFPRAGYDLRVTLLRNVPGVRLGTLGADDRQSKAVRLHGPGSMFSTAISQDGVGGYAHGLKRGRDPIKPDGHLEPFTATLFGEVERLNAELGDEKKAWEQVKTEQTALRNTWEATRKVLCEELALAIRVKSDEAFVAGEAIRALDDKLEENNQNFRAFRATTEAQLTGAIVRAETAESSLATTEKNMCSQQAASLERSQEHAALLATAEAKACSQEAINFKQGQEHAALLQREQAASLKRGQEHAALLATAEARICSQEAINLKQGQEHAALLEHHSRLQQNVGAMVNEHTVLKQAYAALQENFTAQVSAALGRASVAEASLASTLEAVRTSTAACTVPPPLAAQVAPHLQQMASWIENIVHVASLPLDRSFLMDRLHRNGDKAAVEGLIIEVQAQAMGKLPSVQLTPDDRQRLIEYVRAGPPGWVWSPVVPHGYTTAQASNAHPGGFPSNPAPGSVLAAPTPAPALTLAPSPASTFIPAPMSTFIPAPMATPVLAPAPAPTGAPAAPTPVAASQTAYALAMQKLNARSNRGGRQASHARNAAAAAANANAPSAIPATATNPNVLAASTLSNAAAAAPIPATLGVTAVNGAKSQESDDRGATSGRSRRRV